MSLFHLQSKLGRTIVQDNREFLYFSGTDYLGMGSVKEFEDLLIKGLQKYGFNHGLSRINNVRLDIYDQFETFFAEKAGAEKALVWSSGFLAGHATVTYLLEQSDYILAAPDAHPAILPDELSPNAKQSFEDWIKECQETCETLKPQRILILANAVDPLKPVLHDFSWIGYLPRKHTYYLLIDDSHAFGLFGDGIFGTYSKWKYLPVELFVTGSLGKGLGLPGGISLGLTFPIINIANSRTFRGASPAAPGYLQAFLQGQKIYQQRQKKLMSNIAHFNTLIKSIQGVDAVQNYPIYAIKDRRWVKQLEELGIIVSSFPYPSPTDPWINRIIISAFHEERDLQQLAKALENIQSQYTTSTVLSPNP